VYSLGFKARLSKDQKSNTLWPATTGAFSSIASSVPRDQAEPNGHGDERNLDDPREHGHGYIVEDGGIEDAKTMDRIRARLEK
jgi:hypothetical protein